jgi:hypothetical protein
MIRYNIGAVDKVDFFMIIQNRVNQNPCFISFLATTTSLDRWIRYNIGPVDKVSFSPYKGWQTVPNTIA